MEVLAALKVLPEVPEGFAVFAFAQPAVTSDTPGLLWGWGVQLP